MAPKRPRPATVRRDGVPEKFTVTQTHTKDGSRKLKNPKVVEKWRPHCAQPCIGPRNLDLIGGARHERRPSALAKKAGKRRASELDWPDEFGIDGGWSEDEEMMPDEDEREDVGWRAGPCERELLPFNGVKPGPTNPEINSESWCQDIMAELISNEFKDKWIEYTSEHAEAWRDAPRGARASGHGLCDAHGRLPHQGGARGPEGAQARAEWPVQLQPLPEEGRPAVRQAQGPRAGGRAAATLWLVQGRPRRVLSSPVLLRVPPLPFRRLRRRERDSAADLAVPPHALSVHSCGGGVDLRVHTEPSKWPC